MIKKALIRIAICRMNRRPFLQQLAVGGALLTAGCTAIREEPGPFNFGIVNRREQSYHVEYTLWDDAGEIVIDGSVDIAPRPPDGGEYTVLDFPDLIRVTNGDEIDARIQIDGETFEDTYEVTCNRSENAENNWFFQIRHPDGPTTSETGMEFNGSEC
ncbi:hypothetical protein C468_05968 [Halorubrum kocurii JCM 14978]|uniref:Lipoprotein n=2 Tax=Halorubrum kocurii TaxID=478441 RepID=M0P7J8_9EURY|nr:hypothetical protein C468_05968 [Halorubrum kocurii JCM 14978]